MALYRVNVKATRNGFDIHIQEILTPYLWDCFCSEPFSPSKIDKIFKGHLYSYEPELTVYTYDKEDVEDYINEMKDLIREYLNQRLEYTSYLLDVCE